MAANLSSCMCLAPGLLSMRHACRAKALSALEPLGTLGHGLYGGDAIYIFAKLPKDCSDDKAVAKWLVHEHLVSIIPGSGCGERCRMPLCCLCLFLQARAPPCLLSSMLLAPNAMP